MNSKNKCLGIGYPILFAIIFYKKLYNGPDWSVDRPDLYLPYVALVVFHILFAVVILVKLWELKPKGWVFVSIVVSFFAIPSIFSFSPVRLLLKPVTRTLLSSFIVSGSSIAKRLGVLEMVYAERVYKEAIHRGLARNGSAEPLRISSIDNECLIINNKFKVYLPEYFSQKKLLLNSRRGPFFKVNIFDPLEQGLIPLELLYNTGLSEQSFAKLVDELKVIQHNPCKLVSTKEKLSIDPDELSPLTIELFEAGLIIRNLFFYSRRGNIDENVRELIQLDKLSSLLDRPDSKLPFYP